MTAARRPRAWPAPLRWAAWTLLTLSLAAGSYLGFAAATFGLFAALFPPSGHPPLPAAPPGWYTTAFEVMCPALALALTAGVLGVVRRKRRGA